MVYSHRAVAIAKAKQNQLLLNLDLSELEKAVSRMKYICRYSKGENGFLSRSGEFKSVCFVLLWL